MVYELGEEAFEEEPFAHVVSQEFRSKICDFCFAEPEEKDALKCCIRCKVVFYCSNECQVKAFENYHKDECPYFRCKSTMFDKKGNFT